MTITYSPIAEHWDYTLAAETPGAGQDKGSNITEDEIWSGQINIVGSFTITAKVDIQPGTKVIWWGAYEVKVQGSGRFNVLGTATSAVNFKRDSSVSGTCSVVVTTGVITSDYGRYDTVTVRSANGNANFPVMVMHDNIIVDTSTLNGGVAGIWRRNFIFMPRENNGSNSYGHDNAVSRDRDSAIFENNIVIGFRWCTTKLSGTVVGNLLVSWFHGSESRNDYTHEHLYGLAPNSICRQNLFLGPSHAAFMPNAENHASNVIFENNTVALDGGAWHQNYRIEHHGYTQSNLRFRSNLICEKDRGLVETESTGGGKITYTDYNAFYEVGDHYENIAIDGKTEGDAGFGGNDLTLANIENELNNYGYGYPFTWTKHDILEGKVTYDGYYNSVAYAYAPLEGSQLRTAGDPAGFLPVIGCVDYMETGHPPLEPPEPPWETPTEPPGTEPPEGPGTEPPEGPGNGERPGDGPSVGDYTAIGYQPEDMLRDKWAIIDTKKVWILKPGAENYPGGVKRGYTTASNQNNTWWGADEAPGGLDYTPYREIFPSGQMIVGLDRSKWPTSGTVYLTIRYRSFTGPNSQYPNGLTVHAWAGDQNPHNPGAYTIFGHIPLSDDRKWKTLQIPLDIQLLRWDSPKTNNTFHILWDAYSFKIGDHYSGRANGPVQISHMKLSMSSDMSEFPQTDEDGYWPTILDANDRFKDLRQNCDYIPGEEPWFPIGGYTNDHCNLCDPPSDGADVTGEELVGGEGPDDFWRLMSEHGLNAYVIHGGTNHPWNKHVYKANVDGDTGPIGSTPTYVHALGLYGHLARCERWGIRCVPNFLNETKAYHICTKQGGSWPNMREYLREIVREFKDHPNLLAWNYIDEADHEKLADTKPILPIRELNADAKAIDPNTPTYMTIMGTPNREARFSTYTRETADILAIDGYYCDTDANHPPYGMQKTMLGKLHEQYRTQDPNTQIWSVPHMCVTQASRYEKKPSEGYRQGADGEHTVWQAFIALCFGVRGIMFFSIYPPNFPKNQPAIASAWQGLKWITDFFNDPVEGLVTKEVIVGDGVHLEAPGEFIRVTSPNNLDTAGEPNMVVGNSKHVIGSDDGEPPTLIESHDPDGEPMIQWGLFQSKSGAEVLITVNRMRLEHTVTINVTGIADGQKTVLREGRSINFSGGSFTDTWGRYEVHVYVLSGSL